MRPLYDHNQYLVQGGSVLQCGAGYARMGRKFLWNYEKELASSLQRLLTTAMQEWDHRDWQSFDLIRIFVVSLFGFGADIQDSIVQEKCTRYPKKLVLCSANEESHFYVYWLAHLNTFVVQYGGQLVPPSLDVKPPKEL
jgi:hypothetical protein